MIQNSAILAKAMLAKGSPRHKTQSFLAVATRARPKQPDETARERVEQSVERSSRDGTHREPRTYSNFVSEMAGLPLFTRTYGEDRLLRGTRAVALLWSPNTRSKILRHRGPNALGGG